MSDVVNDLYEYSVMYQAERLGRDLLQAMVKEDRVLREVLLAGEEIERAHEAHQAASRELELARREVSAAIDKINALAVKFARGEP